MSTHAPKRPLSYYQQKYDHMTPLEDDEYVYDEDEGLLAVEDYDDAAIIEDPFDD